MPTTKPPGNAYALPSSSRPCAAARAAACRSARISSLQSVRPSASAPVRGRSSLLPEPSASPPPASHPPAAVLLLLLCVADGHGVVGRDLEALQALQRGGALHVVLVPAEGRSRG